MNRVVVLCLLLGVASADGSDFSGWKGLRVIEQEGSPNVMRSGDLNGDGRDELIIINPRYSRLDIYRWLPKDKREAALPSDKDRPNDLPMAADFKRDEVQLEHLPRDLIVKDLDADGKPELIILAASPNKIVIYEQGDDGAWTKKRSVDLLPGNIGSHSRAMVLRSAQADQKESEREILVSFNDGVQRVSLAPDSRADWLSPREKRGRVNWWFVDLDGDGQKDIVEQSRSPKESLRWFQATSDGRLLPAQVLHNQSIKNAAILNTAKGDPQIILIDGSGNGLVKRYTLGKGESSVLGKRLPLPLAEGNGSSWCGVMLDGKPALVVADKDRP
ncbi:MAG: hypothetical protein N2C12_15415, partial [Planctomycetales bacterium]